MRDDLTHSYDFRGRHDLRAGVEFVDHFEDSLNCNQCGGTIDARGTFNGRRFRRRRSCRRGSRIRSTPTPGTSRRSRRGCAPTRSASASSRTSTTSRSTAPGRRTTGASRDKLTLNLGLRYDLSLNSWANDVGLEYKPGQPPFYPAGRPERPEQPAAAPRLRVSAERPDGDPRRLGHVLRRRADGGRVLAVLQHAAAAHSVHQRRPRQLRRRPAQRRAAADLRSGAAAALQQPGAGRQLRRAGRRATSPARRRAS